MKKPIFLFLAIVVLVITTACTNNNSGPEVQARPNELPLRHLRIAELEQQKKGIERAEGIIPRQEKLFSDQKSWGDFWERYVVKNPPAIDFSSEEVAAVFIGPISSGYDVQITKVLYDPVGHHKKIVITEYLPNPREGQLTVMVYPGDLVAFPKSPGDVVFERVKAVRSD